MSIVALIPARNESTIGETVDSVLRQSLPVDVVLVVANNCSEDDLTPAIAREHGAIVIDLGKIPGKKAGAMNRGLDHILRKYPDVEFILQMDADTILDENFVERTVTAMRHNHQIGGLCASFVGQNKEGSSLFDKLLIWAQQQEFVRFHKTQLSLQASVLSGTASLLRVTAIRQLLEQRGYVWDEDCIVEDYETTKALQDREWLCLSDTSFVAYTDVMTTWKELLTQRVRWQCGTLQVVFRDYRGKKCVRLDAWRQVWAYGAFLPHVSGYILMAIAIAMYGFKFSVFSLVWIAIGLYNGWTSRSLGWRKSMLAVTVVPLELYNMLRYYWMYKSWRQFHEVPVGNQSW